MQTCWECNNQHLDGTIFCPECGTDLTLSAPVRRPVRAAVAAGSAPADADAHIAVAVPPAVQDLEVHTPPPAVSRSVRLRLPRSVPKRLIIGRADPGRGFHPDIDLTPYGAMAAGVSRKHALLSIHSDTFQIKDLGSVNGTFVNRERLPSRQTTTLCDDVELRFGTLRLRIEFTA